VTVAIMIEMLNNVVEVVTIVVFPLLLTVILKIFAGFQLGID